MQSDHDRARAFLDGLADHIDQGASEELADNLAEEFAAVRLEARDAIVLAALAWERARQHATEKGLTVERDAEEMSTRMNVYAEREKELRSLVRAALSAAQS